MNVNNLKDSAVDIYKSLGLIPTLILGLIVVAVIAFAIGGATDAFSNWKSGREIEGLKKEADAARKEAEAERAEKEQYKGAAAAYKQQTSEVQNELTKLQLERPELQKKTIEAGKRVEAIRAQPVRPVTDDMRGRIDQLGADLDKLYPE